MNIAFNSIHHPLKKIFISFLGCARDWSLGFISLSKWEFSLIFK
ncbi:hypothetical protein CsSME_00032324 [Camellia sinensis var. sinensis]